MPSTPRSFPSVLRAWLRHGLAFVAAGAPAALVGAESAALQEVVRLPEFKVFETRTLPARESWDYVRIGNFEILSNAPAKTTQRFARDLVRFQNMLQVVSSTMLIRAEHPVMIVLCGQNGQYERFVRDAGEGARRVKNVTFVRDIEIASIVVDYEHPVVAAPEYTAFTAGRNGQAGLGPTANAERPPGFSTERPALTMEEFSRQYILLSLSEMKPRLPAWAAEGLASVYGAIEYSDRFIEIGSPKLFAHEFEENIVTTDFQPQITAQQNRAGQGGFQADPIFGTGVMPATVYAIERPAVLMPMGKLFAVGYDAANRGGIAPDPALATYEWRQQSAAFVHLCLFGTNTKLRAGFLKFASGTSTTPPTEAFFQECFGMTYRDMEFRIRSHWSDGEFKGMRIESTPPPGTRAPELPAPRPATDAEIGRIKGETYRLFAQEEPARQEFVAAYLRGERDLQLLASLGLMARQRQDTTRARTYLEAVGTAPTPVSRPRAYVELSRLRAEAITGGNASVRYTPENVVALLTPLFRAKALPQQLSLVYRDIAAVWARSSVPPEREHVAAVKEGARLFPYDLDLITELAELLVSRGYAADAQPYVQHGLRLARDPGLRARLSKLQAAN